MEEELRWLFITMMTKVVVVKKEAHEMGQDRCKANLMYTEGKQDRRQKWGNSGVYKLG